MRCPKCSYISFDMVEKCVKCGKNISGSATELRGTVASVPPPPFLSPDYSERKQGGAEPEEEEAFDLGDEDEVFVDFSAEEGPAVEAATLVEEPPVEEAAIDISDLAAVEKEPAQFDEVGMEEVAFAIGDEKPSTSEAMGQGLEDLKVEGIDLDASPAPPSGRDTVAPPVKTGTALDNFDVDLDEVFGKK